MDLQANKLPPLGKLGKLGFPNSNQTVAAPRLPRGVSGMQEGLVPGGLQGLSAMTGLSGLSGFQHEGMQPQGLTTGVSSTHLKSTSRSESGLGVYEYNISTQAGFKDAVTKLMEVKHRVIDWESKFKSDERYYDLLSSIMTDIVSTEPVRKILETTTSYMTGVVEIYKASRRPALPPEAWSYKAEVLKFAISMNQAHPGHYKPSQVEAMTTRLSMVDACGIAINENSLDVELQTFQSAILEHHRGFSDGLQAAIITNQQRVLNAKECLLALMQSHTDELSMMFSHEMSHLYLQYASARNNLISIINHQYRTLCTSLETDHKQRVLEIESNKSMRESEQALQLKQLDAQKEARLEQLKVDALSIREHVRKAVTESTNALEVAKTLAAKEVHIADAKYGADVKIKEGEYGRDTELARIQSDKETTLATTKAVSETTNSLLGMFNVFSFLM